MADDNDLPSVLTFSEDIANAKAPAPIPASTYRASVKHAAHEVSKNSGKRMIKIEFHITADQYPADYTDGNPDGTVLSYYVPAEDTPQGRWNVKRACEQLGVPMSREIDVSQMFGREANVKVVHEPYEGQMTAKIARGGISPA